MSPINLKECTPECTECIRSYIKKHRLQKGDSFEIPCSGIPKQYISEEVLSQYSDPEVLISIYDPVVWAAKYLDWHCLDPDGKVWKRKTDEGKLNSQFPPFDEEKARLGKSPFHRPYQSISLKCTSKRKLYLWGRQLGKCLVSGTLIQMSDGTLKKIENIKEGEKVICIDDNYKAVSSEAYLSCNGKKDVYRLTLSDGRSIEASDNHPFLVRRNLGRKTIDKKRKRVFSDEWVDLRDINEGDLIAVPNKINCNIYNSIFDHQENDIVFIKVKSKVYSGNKTTWDLSVPKYKNFIANNIIVHNSEGLVISALHGLFTNDNYKIITLAPFQSQIDMLFSRIPELLERNPNLYNSIKRMVKAPHYTIELNSGSYIKGFSAGTRSKGEAGSVRGQPAHRLLMDECFPKNTKIITPLGKKNIEEIKVGDEIYSFNGVSLEKDVVSDIKETGYKDVYQYDLLNRDIIKCTNNHPFFDGENYKPISKLDNIWISLKDRKLSTTKEIAIARLYACLLSDGWATKSNCGPNIFGFSGSIEGLEQVKEDIRFLVGNKYKLNTYSRRTISPKYGIVGNTNSISAGVDLVNIISEKCHIPYGKKTEQEYLISNFILDGTDDVKKEFISVLFGCEGNKIAMQQNDRTPKTISITFNKLKIYRQNLIDILNQIKDLLYYFDISSIVKQKKDDKADDRGKVKYELRICNSIDNLIKFFDLIGYYYEPHKELESFFLLNYLKEKVKYSRNQIKFNEWIKQRCDYSRKTIKIPIINSSYIGKYNVFNITTSKNHTFLINNGYIVHNCDYLSAEDINAVAAVITNFPNAEVVMSSTPTGRRENFYNTYHGKIYKSFHYSSKVNPMWSEDLEKYFRSQLTELGYEREIEANFGEQEEGVYQNRYIEMCEDNYEYSNMKPDPRWTYSFGVDWNDVKIGTVIIITGFNPSNNLYYVVDKHIISKAGWTQTAAMQKIIELNRMWRPEFIYIDRGYGHAQEEILHGFGADALVNKDIPKIWNNDARLAKVVKSYDFGGSIEIRDLFTKKPIKKPAKPFLVENAVRKFERNELRFPRSDQKLIDSLGGYIIKKISQGGTPVYSTNNEQAGDHLVDALNLSLIGFTLEGSALGKPKYITDIAFSGQFGETKEQTSERINNNASSSRKDENFISGERTSRTEYIRSSPSVFGARVPAVSSKLTERKIWSWPGFLKDKPPPQRRRKVSSRSLMSRPQRKNI